MTNPLNYISKYVSPTVLKNSGWLIFDKVLAALISFVVYFVTANYLGPEVLGQYNYALSVVSIFATFGTLGLDSLIVRDFINGKFKKENILGSVFILRCIGSLLVVAISLCVVIISKHDLVISLITGILSSVYILRSFQVLDSFYLANKNVKPSVIARNIGAILSAILKILMVLLKLDVIYFAIATSAEFIIATIILVGIYRLRYRESLLSWRFDFSYMKYLLSKGWVIMLGVLFAAFANRFDQYLLGTIQGDYAVGIYSPAVKLSEFWYYVPMAFLDSVYPTLVEAKKKNYGSLNKKLIRTSAVLFYVSLAFCIGISLFADLIIRVFLNSEFEGASGVLRIYVWGTLGTVMTSFLLRWLIIEEKQGQLVIATFINFLLNSVLNIILVPSLGVSGAAWATAISYNLGWIFVIFILNRGGLDKIIFESIILPIRVIFNKFSK